MGKATWGERQPGGVTVVDGRGQQGMRRPRQGVPGNGFANRRCSAGRWWMYNKR